MRQKKYWNRIEGRIAAGIIKQNDLIEAPFIIRECCNAPSLNHDVENEIRKDSQELQRRRIDSDSIEFRSKKNKDKFIIKKNIKNILIVIINLLMNKSKFLFYFFIFLFDYENC